MSAATPETQAAILVVDDNPGKRLSSIAVLEPLGHAIVEATSGEAALRAVMNQTFAVILMDVQMPEMDGYETARLIGMRGQSEHTPIIFITAYSSEEAKIPLAYSSGAVDFIFAPVVPDVLRAKVTIFVELFLKSRALERSAAQLRDSEARTRSVLDNVADGIVTLTDTGLIESFNRAASELFGYSEQEAIGEPFATMVGHAGPGDFADHGDAKRLNLNPRPTGGRSVESVGRRKDGSTFPMELSVTDVQLGTGTIHIGCLRDISERQTYTKALQHQARHFDLSHDLVCTAGFDGYFKQLNTAWTQTLGWSETELRSRPSIELVHPDDREATERQSAELGAGGVTVGFVNRYATKDGGWRWIDWSANSIVEEGLIYASARDVTDRITAEAAVLASERQTRLILETAHDAFISIDAAGLITEWNSEAQATFGWSRDEALGRELAATVIPERHRDAHRDGIKRCLATGEAAVPGRRLELTALHRDGREFPVELTISPLQTEAGAVSFNAFLRDITERKRVRAQLALARDQALEASRMKSMFVANVSHEIRTPMNGVIGMSELLLDSGLDDAQREYAETICSSGEALLTIIDDILDFSKIEAGKLELDPTDFDLRDTIERASAMLAARAHEKGLELAVAIAPEVPGLVRGDAARLRQVIANLVANAIKFTSTGEVVVRATSAAGTDDPALVRVEVTDTGIGIAPEALEQLFKPYSQADSSTTRKYGGTGLGLAISRQLIELMDGEVGAESEPGNGSCFWFEVSLTRAEATNVAPEEEREIAGLRVLVVDDNATNRTILERQLNAWQMSCEVAENAAQAMTLLESAAADGIPFALALLDLNMPEVDGDELARAIRAKPTLGEIRLVLLSSSGARPNTHEQAPLDGWLTKPVRQSPLYQEIQAVLAGEHRDRQRAPTPAVTDTPAAGDGPGSDVLVVEDTPINQLVAARMLEKCGFRPHIAATGREALEALTVQSYAAVLMDCQMPELDGYETTREIRRLETGTGRHIPIIAMTANSMQGERERCLAEGMDDYLAKPLRNRTLKEALTRWITQSASTSTAPDRQATSAQSSSDDPGLLDETTIAELKTLDAEVFDEVLSLYFDETVIQMTELTGAVDRADTVAVGKAAHKLNGSSSALGASHISHIAAQLEATANLGDLATADALIAGLHSALADTRKAFATRVR